jgi:large subunit ribosomal protein L3
MKIIGKKLGMTSVFTEDGESVAVTLIELGPCKVTQLKSADGPDGYNAVQISFADGKKEKNTSKALKGHFSKAGVEVSRYVEEERVDSIDGYEIGQVVSVADLDEALPVIVVGTSKGRGFAGGMKRHGFAGHRASHGEEKHHRTNGSLSSSARLTHVWKGKRMSGHMGNVRLTVKNLDIIKVDAEKNLLVVKGCVPGHSGAKVTVVQ